MNEYAQNDREGERERGRERDRERERESEGGGERERERKRDDERVCSLNTQPCHGVHTSKGVLTNQLKPQKKKQKKFAFHSHWLQGASRTPHGVPPQCRAPHLQVELWNASIAPDLVQRSLGDLWRVRTAHYVETWNEHGLENIALHKATTVTKQCSCSYQPIILRNRPGLGWWVDDPFGFHLDVGDHPQHLMASLCWTTPQPQKGHSLFRSHSPRSSDVSANETWRKTHSWFETSPILAKKKTWCCFLRSLTFPTKSHFQAER